MLNPDIRLAVLLVLATTAMILFVQFRRGVFRTVRHDAKTKTHPLWLGFLSVSALLLCAAAALLVVPRWSGDMPQSPELSAAIPVSNPGSNPPGNPASNPAAMNNSNTAAAGASFAIASMGKPASDASTSAMTSQVLQRMVKDHTSTSSDNADGKKAASVSKLTSGLEQKLKENPQDGSGWLLLARSYVHLGEPARAAEAYQKATALGFADAELALKIGTSKPDPHSATAANKRTKEAFVVSGELTASPAASALIPDNATIFIVVKDENGSPMPLAVTKFDATELPITFSLDADDVIVRSENLTAAKKMIVSARVSPDGNAMKSVMGITSTKTTIENSATGLNLVLVSENE